MPRPPPPADALTSTGKPISCADAHRFGFFRDQAGGAGHDRHLGFAGQLAGRVLVAEARHGLGRGTDEVDLATAADFVEVRVLGQKAVAGMNRLHVADFGGADHAIDLAVAVGALGRPDAIGLVGQLEIGGASIGFAEDGHGFHTQLAASADDAQRNLTAIGDQDSFVHPATRCDGQR